MKEAMFGKDICVNEKQKQLVDYMVDEVKNCNVSKYHVSDKNGPKPTKRVIERKIKQAEKGLENTKQFYAEFGPEL